MDTLKEINDLLDQVRSKTAPKTQTTEKTENQKRMDSTMGYLALVLKTAVVAKQVGGEAEKRLYEDESLNMLARGLVELGFLLNNKEGARQMVECILKAADGSSS